MQKVNNKAIVDKAVDILAGLYKGILRQHHLNGNVDFSGLSEQIMAALEQGATDRVESIISRFVEDKIRNYDKVAGELARKADRASDHRRTVDDLIGFSKKWNSQCADAITRNVVIDKKQEEAKSFRESLANFKSSSTEPANEVPIDEVFRRNAQSVYERTGNIPEGYILNKDGQVMKDRSSEETSRAEPQEKPINDIQR